MLRLWNLHKWNFYANWEKGEGEAGKGQENVIESCHTDVKRIKRKKEFFKFLNGGKEII